MFQVGQQPGVEKAVQGLISHGADIRVRALDRFTAPTLELYERNMEQSCQSWQAPDGGRKNNLIVIAVAVQNRKSGIYYGSQWKPVLDSQWPRIESQVMAPRFRDHDFAGGIAAALDEIGRLIERQASAPAGSVVIDQSAPMDLSGLWWFLKWALILAFGGLAAVFILRRLTERRKERRLATAAQREAILAAQDAAAAVSSIPDATEMEFARLKIGEKNFLWAKTRIEAAVEMYGSRRNSSVWDPDRHGLLESEYRSMANGFTSIVAEIDQAKKTLAGSAAGPSSVPKEPKEVKYPKRERVVFEQPKRVHVAVDHESVVREYVNTSPSIVVINSGSYSSPAPAPDPPSSSLGSSDSSSGGSSDWGSSSSDSGGGSCDFGSSSGGGGDSGW